MDVHLKRSGMVKETGHRKELIQSVANAFQAFTDLVKEFDTEAINWTASPGSWSAAQVADHVTKSNHSIARALLVKGTLINRNPFERVPELKKVFLDFNTKLKAPDFIWPGQVHYEKNTLVKKLLASVGLLLESAEGEELLEMINHPAFGDITKFEILHFVVYHTLRHVHQLEKIRSAYAANQA